MRASNFVSNPSSISEGRSTPVSEHVNVFYLYGYLSFHCQLPWLSTLKVMRIWRVVLTDHVVAVRNSVRAAQQPLRAVTRRLQGARKCVIVELRMALVKFINPPI